MAAKGCVMATIEFEKLYRFRQEPDVYDGEKFDQHRPRWIVGMPKEGDEDIGNTIIIKAEDYPPGTEVIIKEPLCPKCRDIYENCMARHCNAPCDFDWKNWTEEMYS